MRPNSPYQQSLVSRRFRGDDVVIYAVPKGTALPDDLILVHERSDHYSLQPAVTMNIAGKCTFFLFHTTELNQRQNSTKRLLISLKRMQEFSRGSNGWRSTRKRLKAFRARINASQNSLRNYPRADAQLLVQGCGDRPQPAAGA